jgi:hypothetical protein
MAYSPIHPLLAHLSEAQLAELIRRYYGRERIKDLLSFYKIDCLPNKLCLLLPLELCNDPCPNCGGTMIKPRFSRDRLRFKEATGTACTECLHKTGRRCYCGYCQQQRTTNVKEAKQQVVGAISKVEKNTRPIQPDKLSLQRAVSVLALSKSFGSFGFDRATALNNFAVPFAPMGYYGDRLINTLVNAGLLKTITNYNENDVSAFLGNTRMPNPYAILWNVPEQAVHELISTILDLVESGTWPQHWYAELSNVIFDIALAECSEFFDFCAKERQFPAVDEQKKFSLIYGLLRDFSVGFSCRAINSAAQYAADHLVTMACTPQQAANYMLMSCQRWADKARVEKWQVKPFRRNINCPRSMMSLVLFETFLNISDDAGFNMPLSDIDPQIHDVDLYRPSR